MILFLDNYDSWRSFPSSPTLCFDGAAYYDRYGRYGNRDFLFTGDYLFHNYKAIKASIPIPVYYGLGAQYLYVRDIDSYIGVRGTFGAALEPRSIPFDFFFELSPALWLYPEPDFDLQAGLGARFWF
jgi:hypothetical protein